MKNLLTLFLIFLSASSFAFKHNGVDSFPIQQNLGSPNTIVNSSGALRSKLINQKFTDTTQANTTQIKLYAGAQIFTTNDNSLWYRNPPATQWVKFSSSSNSPPPSVVTIIDSTHFTVCTVNSCDTFSTTTVNANTVRILNDSTVEVCQYAGSCDTIHINPSPIIPSGKFVDTVFSKPSTLTDSVYAGKSGVNSLVKIFDRNCGLISPGVVTYDSLLIFTVSPAIYILCSDGIRRTSVNTNVTLAAADPTNPRLDVIILDATGVTKITGTPAADPAAPVVSPSQILLTTILVPAGATSITACATPDKVIYDENTGSPEWAGTAIGATVNFSSLIAPYHLLKSADVGSVSNGNGMSFLSPTALTFRAYTTLKFFVRLKATFSANTSFQVSVVTSSGTSTVNVLNGTYGFNRTVVGTFQAITIPVLNFNAASAGIAFQLSTPQILTMKFTVVGSNASGFYLDYPQLGGSCIVQPTPVGTTYTVNNGDSLYTGNVIGLGGDVIRNTSITSSGSKYLDLAMADLRHSGITYNANPILDAVFIDTSNGGRLYKQNINFYIRNGGQTGGFGDSLMVIEAYNSIYFKRLKAGTGITFTVADSLITINSSAASYTSSNGITLTSSNFKLGGTLIDGTTTLAAGANVLDITGANATVYTVSINSTGTSRVLQVTANSSNTAIYGISSVGAGISGNTTAGHGTEGVATTGMGAYGEATTGWGGSFVVNPSSTNTVVPMARLIRYTSGTASAGIGGSLDFYTNTSDLGADISNTIVSKLTVVADATRTSTMIITGVLAGSTVNILTLNSNKSIQLTPITATAASAITPAEGMLLFASSTDATFTSIGLWCYENGAWSKK